MKNLRRPEQRLGRNAAPVQADAAQIVPFDDRGLKSELRRANGTDITPGTGANDDDIETRISHSQPLAKPLGLDAPAPYPNQPPPWQIDLRARVAGGAGRLCNAVSVRIGGRP